jgi:hypothetical protein
MLTPLELRDSLSLLDIRCGTGDDVRALALVAGGLYDRRESCFIADDRVWL